MSKKMKQSSALAAKWTELIRDCQTSRLTIKEFAQQNRIGVGTLYIWSKRLGLSLRGQNQSELSFIELGPVLRNNPLHNDFSKFRTNQTNF